MSESMAVAAGQGTAAALLAERARDYFRQAKAASTVASYTRDWRDFSGWCQTQARVALPAHPETVALYLTDLAETR
jgi:site-specific recombinase XerD